MEKENQRIVITKRLLKEALLRLLDGKSIEQVSITELCQEAGINRATFYRHYMTPHDLLLDMEMEIISGFRGKSGSYDSMAELEENLTGLCVYISKNLGLVKVLIRNNSADEFIELFASLYRDYLITRNRNNVPNPLNSDAIALVANYLAGGGYYMLRQWIMEDIPKTPEEISALILGITNLDYVCHWAKSGQV